MDILELQTAIKTNTLPNFCVFYGDEWKVQESYLKAISRVKNLPIVRVDSIASVFKKIVSPTMFTKPALYVVRDDKDISTSEKLQGVLFGGDMHNNMVVELISSLDKRTKFYRMYKDSCVEFSRLNDDLLTTYIRREINLNAKNCKRLIDICDGSYGQILLEIDKLRCLTEYRFDEAFQMCLDSGAIYQPPTDAIFDFVDAVLMGKRDRSFALLEHCYGVNEPTLVLLSVLYSNTKQTLQVQACESSDIEKSTGLTKWQIKNAKKRCGVWSNGDLVYLMKLIQRMEKGIKTGTIEDSKVLDLILVNFYGG